MCVYVFICMYTFIYMYTHICILLFFKKIYRPKNIKKKIQNQDCCKYINIVVRLLCKHGCRIVTLWL